MRYGRKVLAGIPKTIHGGQAWKIGGIEDYSHNLNPLGPPKYLSKIIEDSINDVGHYPDDNCTELKAVISSMFSLKEENIIIGAGSSEIIKNFPNAFIEKGEKVIINDPSFAEYSQQCRLAGAEIVYNELNEEGDFRIDVDELNRSLKGVKALYICNPNNPTGRIEPRDKILKIVKECEDEGILVFIDETLLELVRGYEDLSCMKYVNRFENLVVAGSLTKSFAVPGIRIGFGTASAPLIGEMDKIRMTWNVGQIEQDVAGTLLSDHMDHVKKAAYMMAEESLRMYSELKEVGFPTKSASDSFFYFCSVKELGITGSEFQQLMLRDKIMIRDCASFGPRFKHYVRFSVKDRERNDMFLKAVENAIGSVR